MFESDGNNALDLANLDTQPIEHSGEYEESSEFFRPPEPGKETILLDEAPTDEKFYPLKDFESGEAIPGFAFNGKWKIQGGAQDGKTFYAMLDTRKKPNREGSDVEDYVRTMKGAGQAVSTKTYGDLKKAIQGAFAPVGSRLTWIGDKKDEGTGKRPKLSDFPLKADGKTREHVYTAGDGEKIGAKVKIAAIFNPAGK